MNDSQTLVEARPEAPAGMVYSRKGVLVKQRKPQTARSSKVFLVMQIVDAEGNVLSDMAKKNIKILSVQRSSDKVLELIDSNDYEGAFYLRVDLTPK